MTLADFEPASEKIVIGRGKTLAVHGLTLPNVSLLVRSYYERILVLFDRYLENSANDIFGTSNFDQFALTLIKDTPEIAAAIIAIAAHEPEMATKAEMLPFPTQIIALTTIFKLTFEEAGGPKKFFETLQSLVGPLLPADMAAQIKEVSRNLRERLTSPTEPSAMI